MSKGTFQKFMCVARISQDLELKYTASGTAVLSFSAATNKSWKGQDGNQVEKAEFHKFVAWNKHAENISKYFSKGNRIMVEGKLETRSWEDQNGVKRYTTEIKVDKWEFVDSNQQQQTSSEPEPSEPPQSEEDDRLPF